MEEKLVQPRVEEVSTAISRVQIALYSRVGSIKDKNAYESLTIS